MVDRENKTLVKVNFWLYAAKLLSFVGVIIFIISTVSGQVDGELAAYGWMALGITTTIIMTTILLGRESNDEGVFSLIAKMAVLYIPALAILVPIIAMILIFWSVRDIMSKDDAHLPSQFYTFHYLTFFLLFLQIIMLYHFFNSVIKTLLTKGTITGEQKMKASAFFFSGFISLSLTGYLYIIITRFITDG